MLFCARDLPSCVYVWRFLWNFNQNYWFTIRQILTDLELTIHDSSIWVLSEFPLKSHFRENFLLPYASSPAFLGDLIGPRVSESCNCSASDVFHSRTANLRSGHSIIDELPVIRDHWCQKRRKPIVTANSVKSIVESSWFLKKVDGWLQDDKQDDNSSSRQNWRLDKIGDSGVKRVILEYCRCTTYCST